jgi:hypothetical protein
MAEAHHALIVHPNEETEGEEELEKVNYYRWVDSSLVNWYGAFHDQTLRPTFIRKDYQPIKRSKSEVVKQSEFAPIEKITKSSVFNSAAVMNVDTQPKLTPDDDFKLAQTKE